MLWTLACSVLGLPGGLHPGGDLGCGPFDALIEGLRRVKPQSLPLRKQDQRDVHTVTAQSEGAVTGEEEGRAVEAGGKGQGRLPGRSDILSGSWRRNRA